MSCEVASSTINDHESPAVTTLLPSNFNHISHDLFRTYDEDYRFSETRHGNFNISNSSDSDEPANETTVTINPVSIIEYYISAQNSANFSSSYDTVDGDNDSEMAATNPGVENISATQFSTNSSLDETTDDVSEHFETSATDPVIEDTTTQSPHQSTQFNSELSRLLSYPDFLLPWDKMYELVKNGFYLSENGNVQCAFCSLNISLESFSIGEVHQLHQDRSSECPLIVNPTLNTNKTFLGYESDLSYEQYRLITFLKAGWPKQSSENYAVGALDLAKNAFYYTGVRDKVVCIVCRLEIESWEDGDTAEGEHRRWNRSCPFLNGDYLWNVPLHQRERNVDPELRSVTRGLTENLRQPIESVIDDDPRHPKFRNLDSRMDSYTQWPVSMEQKPKELSEAGFFYSGVGDRVICYHCGVGLRDWGIADDPWIEHGACSPNCSYILRKKGQDFINDAKAKKEAKMAKEKDEEILSQENLKIDSASSDQQSADKRKTCSKKIPLSRRCKVCMDLELGIVFLPCGHMAACPDCAPQLNQCPICRALPTAYIRAYLA